VQELVCKFFRRLTIKNAFSIAAQWFFFLSGIGLELGELDTLAALLSDAFLLIALKT